MGPSTTRYDFFTGLGNNEWVHRLAAGFDCTHPSTDWLFVRCYRVAPKMGCSFITTSWSNWVCGLGYSEVRPANPDDLPGGPSLFYLVQTGLFPALMVMDQLKLLVLKQARMLARRMLVQLELNQQALTWAL